MWLIVVIVSCLHRVRDIHTQIITQDLTTNPVCLGLPTNFSPYPAIVRLFQKEPSVGVARQIGPKFN